EEMGNCWRCGTPIRRAQKIEQPIILDISEASFFIESKLLGRLGGVAALGLLLAALFMGIRLLLEYSDGNTAFTSLSQLYTYEFVPSRIAAGLTLLFFWPIVLRITVRILCTTSKPKVVHLYIGGTLLGALALVILLMPIPAPLLVPGSGILVLAALVVSVIAVQFRTGKALLVCGIHLLIMSVLGASAFWATEMYRHNAVLNPVSETNTLLGFAAESSENTQRLSSIITPIRDEIEWGSSGSAWLDAKIATTTITIHLEEKDPSLSFQIYEDKKLQFHEELGERRNHTFQYDISPASHYEFAVSGTENLSVQVLIQSLLPFDILK
ncbi:MAG: hypothetical protein KAH38_12570, partial [Candidatus Hydrogenedentes bacterium]|nr:hypothetical protein [Candidatus Hydrogenedentota bacterium]